MPEYPTPSKANPSTPRPTIDDPHAVPVDTLEPVNPPSATSPPEPKAHAVGDKPAGSPEGHDEPSLKEKMEARSKQEHERRLEEVQRIIKDDDLGNLAHEVTEWLSPRMVNSPELGGVVLPVTHHEELRRRLTGVLTKGYYVPFGGVYKGDQSEGLRALMEAVDLVPFRDTLVSAEGAIDCPPLFPLELERDVGHLDAIRKALNLLGGTVPRFRTAKDIENAIGTAWASAPRLSEVFGKDLKDWVRRWYEKLPPDQQEFAQQPIKEPGKGPKDEYKVSMLAPDLCAHLHKHS